MKIQGQNVWLIGASSGIGAALVPRLMAAGAANLAISARRTEVLQGLAEQHQAEGRPILVKPLDVTDILAIQQVADELTQAWDKIDILLYSAGTWIQTPVSAFDTQTVLDQIDVNYLGLVRATGTVLKQMIDRRGGEIIGVASLGGYAGLPNASAYSSSKAAAINFLQSLRIDLRRFGVGVTTVNPGFIKTPLTDKNKFPMPYLMDPEDAADTIVKGLEAGHSEIHFPKRLSWSMKLWTAMPRPVYEWLSGLMMARG